MKKKHLYWVSTISFALIILVVLLAYGIYQKLSYDKSSQDITLAVTQSVLADWNPASLIENIHSSLIESQSEERLSVYFNLLRRLGAVRLLESIEGEANVPTLFSRDGPITASYVIQAQFENGPATIEAELVLENKRWLFTRYRVVTVLIAD